MATSVSSSILLADATAADTIIHNTRDMERKFSFSTGDTEERLLAVTLYVTGAISPLHKNYSFVMPFVRSVSVPDLLLVILACCSSRTMRRPKTQSIARFPIFWSAYIPRFGVWAGAIRS